MENMDSVFGGLLQSGAIRGIPADNYSPDGIQHRPQLVFDCVHQRVGLAARLRGRCCTSIASPTVTFASTGPCTADLAGEVFLEPLDGFDDPRLATRPR